MPCLLSSNKAWVGVVSVIPARRRTNVPIFLSVLPFDGVILVLLGALIFRGHGFSSDSRWLRPMMIQYFASLPTISYVRLGT